MYYLYILKCSDNSFYTGIANNLEKRLEVHKSGKGSKYVRAKLPFRLVYSEELETKSLALKREFEIKKMTKLEKMKLVGNC
jgi:putative endonuclease